ncbi:MAG: methyl-accepting chemotaxis protein, partial [Spirochaetota bacterium]|nr:methyl-accepting chemotaxis protein [Spirochaetota bacterium]
MIKKNNLLLKLLVINIMATMIFMVANRISLIFEFSIFIEIDSMPELLIALVKFLGLRVLPFLILTSFIIYLIARPIQRAVNLIHSGQNPTPEVLLKAKKALTTLPRFILIIITLFFIIGGLNFRLSKSVYDEYSLIYNFIYIVYFFASGISVSFFQISLNNIYLAKAREQLKIHYVENNKELSLKVRNLLLVGGLMTFLICFAYIELYNIKFLDTKYNREIELVRQGKKDMNTAKNDYYKALSVYVSILYEYEKKVTGPFPLTNDVLDRRLHNYDIFFLSVIIEYLLLLSVIIYTFSKEFSGRVKRLQERMHDIMLGEGDLTRRISIIHFDELGELTDRINRFMENLRLMLLQVNGMSNELKSSSEALNSSVQQASAVAEEVLSSLGQIESSTGYQNKEVTQSKTLLLKMVEAFDKITHNVNIQSSFVEETSSAITEMAMNIQSVSETTNSANILTDTLVEVAEKGNQSVKNSVTAIKDIEESSRQVGEII